MCKFCEGLFNDKREVEWYMRSEYADDNFCEKVFNNSCDNCKKCSNQYILKGYLFDNRAYIVCDYKFTNGDILMWNSTEPLPVNYCPYCGRKLSKSIIDFNNIGGNAINMLDKEGD